MISVFQFAEVLISIPVIESHSETAPSLRLTRPIPALKEWAQVLDYASLDPTEHAHIPFSVILVKEAEKWKAEAR